MRHDLKPGLKVSMDYLVPEGRTVPHLLPEAAEMRRMPEVLATGFLVGLCEWACIRAIEPFIDWPRVQSVGVGVDLSHEAATPPGMAIRIRGSLARVEGRLLLFELEASDERDLICRGSHKRALIDFERFSAKARAKGAREAGSLSEQRKQAE